MKLCVFFPSGIGSAWACSWGIPRTLRRMGHDVDAFPLDSTKPSVNRAANPKPDDLSRYDAVIISGPEHIRLHLRTLYPDLAQLKIPKAAFFHESFERDDYILEPKDFAGLADHFFYPAWQDAQRFGGTFLPFAADLAEFGYHNLEKKFEVAFIGQIYQKRREWLNKTRLGIKTGNVIKEDLDGVDVDATRDMYVRDLNRIKVFLNLPALSRLVVSKVVEVMACGTFIFSPIPQGPHAKENMAHLKGVEWYDPDNIPDLVDRLRYFHSHDAEREARAEKNLRHIHEHHRLDQRLQQILDCF